MTPLAWAAVAAAVLLTLRPSTAPLRVDELTKVGRLPGVTATGRSGTGRSGTGRSGRGSRASGRPIGLVALTLAAAIVTAVGTTGGPVLAAAAAAVMATAAVLARDLVVRRNVVRADHELLVGLRVLVAELEAGSRPAEALSAAATAGPAVAEVFQRAGSVARTGADPADVLAGDPRPGIRSTGIAWRLGRDTGVALAAVLDRVVVDLAAADEQRRAVAVALAGPRSSAVLLSGLPVLGVGLGAAMGADPLTFLTAQPTGRLLCLVGVLLDVGGVLWTRAILHRAEGT